METHSTDNTQEQPNLQARFWYLCKLMRHSGGGMFRGGRGPGGGRRGGEAHGQGRVLSMLALHSPISQRELAYLLGIRSQSLAELLKKLENDGFVERQPHPEDRRTSTVNLTDAGREVLEKEQNAPRVNPFAILTNEESKQLAGLVDKIIDELEDNLPEGPDERMQAFKERAFGPEGFEGFGGFEGREGRGGFGGRGGWGFGRF